MNKHSLAKLFRLRCRVVPVSPKQWLAWMVARLAYIYVAVGALSSFSLIVLYGISPNSALGFVNEYASNLEIAKWSVIAGLFLLMIVRDAGLYWRFPTLRLPKSKFDTDKALPIGTDILNFLHYRPLENVRFAKWINIAIVVGALFLVSLGYGTFVGWSGNESVYPITIFSPPPMAFGEEYILTHSVPGATIPPFLDLVYVAFFAVVAIRGAFGLIASPFIHSHIPVPARPRNLRARLRRHKVLNALVFNLLYAVILGGAAIRGVFGLFASSFVATQIAALPLFRSNRRAD